MGSRGDRRGSPVVCDASPLIALERIGRLDLIREVFGVVVVPPAVVRELGPTTAPAWVVERALTKLIDARVRAARLDPGESEVIALALELGGRRVVLDDQPARRLARDLGLPVIGTEGVLLTAKLLALLTDVRPHLEALVAGGFHVGPELFGRALFEAREAE